MRASCFNISLPALDARLLTSNKDFAPSSFTIFHKAQYIEISRGVTHLALHILSIVLPVDLARRRVTLYSKSGIPNLGRQPVLEIQKTCLANILDLRAGLADDGSLVSHAGARVPAEDGERSGTCSA